MRAMKNDEDRGEAYTNRVVTLAGLFLGLVTALLIVAAPYVMSIFLSDTWDDPSLAAERDSLITFARLCLPQVFFYGMFVLVGQILNSRGRFGPMMWAPIANNVVSMVVLVVYIGGLRHPLHRRGSPPARSCCSASARRPASRCSS